MDKRAWLTSASAILLASLPALPGYAADAPAQDSFSAVRLGFPRGTLVLAQNTAQGTAPSTPPNEGSSSGLRVNPSNTTVGNTTLAETQIPEPPLSGPLSSVGRFLLNHGINFHPAVIDHFWANPSTGIDQGHTYNLGILALNGDVDLQRLIGLPGGNIHATYAVLGLKSDIPPIISQAGGTLTGYQTTPALSNSKISELTYEQKLFNDTLSIEAGRTNLYRYFLLNNSLDPFNAISTTFSVDADAVPFINPTWGGRVRYNLSPAWYVQAGAFEDYWRRSIVRPFELNTIGAYGYQVLGEVGYRTEFATEAYPANFEVGLEYNNRSGYYNFKGTARPAQVVVRVRGRNVTVNFTAADYDGGEVFFAQGKKVIYRGAARDGFPEPQNIALFGSIAFSTDKPQPIDFDTFGGIQFNGFIPYRPADSVEFMARYQRLSQLEANFETAQQATVSGPGPAQGRNNYSLQLTYNLQATSAISFRPYAQYFVHPDVYYNPSGGRSRDGWGAGFLFTASLSRLLGLSPL